MTHGTPLKTEEIGGQKVEITVTPTGTFYAYFEGDDDRVIASSDRLESLTTEVKRKLRATRKRVSVKFWTEDGVEGIAYTLHAGSGYPMVRLEGKSEQWSRYSTSALKGDTPPEKIERLGQIEHEKKQLEAERKAILTKWEFDLRRVVREALTEANDGEQL